MISKSHERSCKVRTVPTPPTYLSWRAEQFLALASHRREGVGGVITAISAASWGVVLHKDPHSSNTLSTKKIPNKMPVHSVEIINDIHYSQISWFKICFTSCMYYTGQPKIMITDFKPLKPNFRLSLRTESTVSVDVLTHADRCVCVCTCVYVCTVCVCVYMCVGCLSLGKALCIILVVFWVVISVLWYLLNVL